jgi:CubicO group peptidase (beta-lactamase class C family)
MLAINDERIKPDDLASDYIPQWRRDPLKGRITVRQLATHTSGLEDAEANGLSHDKLTGWKGDFWKRSRPPRDPFTLARDVAPVVDTPGMIARYSNPGMAMLGYCVTRALSGSTNSDLRSLLRDRIMKPLAIPESEWSVGYGKPIEIDGAALVATWGGANYSPNAAAQVGRLLLHNGNWDGHQLIDRSVVEMATTWAGVPNHSGLGWWVNRQPDGTRFWEGVPEDAFYGAGAGHQILLVVPSLSLIVVRNGEQLDPKESFDAGLEKHLVVPLMACLAATGATSVPPAR